MRRADHLVLPVVIAAALAAAAPAHAGEAAAPDEGPVAVAAVGDAPARAAARKRSPVGVVCATRAPVLETPDGLVVGSVTRGDRVFVLRRARRWTRVRTEWGTRGWLARRHLCRR